MYSLNTIFWETTTEAIELLSKVGVNDTFIFLRPYRRLVMDKASLPNSTLIALGKSFWLVDEFTSTLDRDTAKILAF